jgi:hypothetical protein
MRALPRVLVFLTMTLVGAPGHALISSPNILPNHDFDADLAGWTIGGATWDPDVDRSNADDSGSARVAVPGEVGSIAELSTCVRIVGGESYVFGTRYFIPTGQVPSGEARVIVSWYDDPDCTDYMEGDSVPYTQDHGVVGAWTTLTEVATPNVNADSARLSLAGWKLVGQENQPDLIAYFDGALLLPEPGAAVAMSAALGSLAALSRKRFAGCRRAPSRPSDRRASAARAGR